MSTDLTPLQQTIVRQRRAALPGSSAWVSANAGSGKTRVLTDRVIRLMLDGAEPGAILSITFTKAAAAEMSNRLFQRLGEWAALPDRDLRRNLVELAGQEIGGGFPLDEARRLFARALETPGGLKIQTIHAFSESVLGRFPLEAGLSPEFSVMDEAAAFEMLEELKQQLLTGAGLDDEAASALERMLDGMADQSFDSLLQNAINERRKIREALKHHGGVAAVTSALRRELGIGPDDDQEAIRAAGCAAGAWNEIGLRRLVRAFRDNGGKQAVGRAEAIAAWLASDDDGRRLMLDDYLGVFLTQQGTPRKDFCPAKVRKADPAMEDIADAEQDRIVALADRMKAAATADATRDLLLISEPLLTRYATIKRRRALLDYDDQIDMTLQLLESQAAWVHFKLDQGIGHILIDEAQDTSPEQWRIAELLSTEFFSGEGARPGPRTVFAVGDEKQSIYSFQGADPDGFDRMRQRFHDRAHEAGGGFEGVQLELSFRSAPEILTAVDAVFSGPAAEGLTASGAPVQHEAQRETAQGVVELWPLDEPVGAEDPDRWKAPLDVAAETSTRRRLAQRIARRIRRMLDDGETVCDRRRKDAETRRITPGDVLILVRSRGALVDEIARALKSPEIGIPVAGADRMALTEQIAVMDLMALGDFLLLPDDDLTLATVLKSPFYNFSDDDLFRLAWNRGKGVRLWRVLRERGDEEAHWRAARDELQALLAEADQAAPYDFYSRFLSAGGGRRRLHARLGTDQMDPLDEFLNAALEDERDNPPSLQGFLHRLRRSGATIKRDMDQGMDAVRIMTVHGAKGLEAPIVFLPDTTRPARGDSGGLMTLPDAGGHGLPVVTPAAKAQPERLAAEAEAAKARSLAEYYRLLYVAMTRAEDRLYVCGFYNSERAKPSEDGWYRVVEAGLRPIAEEDADGVLRLGAAPPPDKVARAPVTDRALPPWLTAPPPEEPAPPRPLAPSRTEGDDPAQASPLLPAATGQGRRRGVLIHHLLEVLPDLDPAIRAEAGRRSLARRAANLDEAEREEMLAEALAVLADPAMAPVFAPGSRAEVPVTGMVGKLAVSGQIDRLAVNDEAVWIIDYKTNRPPPETVQDVALGYRRQMALYREILGQIHPGKPVRSALVWTWKTRMMVLPDDMLDAALASLDLTESAT